MHPLRGTWTATQAYALDWKSNPQPFGPQAGTQSTDPHQPEPKVFFILPLLHKFYSLVNV